MIEVIGEEGTSEYRAAINIAESIKSTFKGVERTPAAEELVKIVVSAKLSGYNVSDVDIVICAVFKENRFFKPTRFLRDSAGKRVMNKPIRATNLVAAVEVKDHDDSAVIINGDNILVKYHRGAKQGEKSAIDQNIKQLHAISGYMADLGINIFVHRSVYMTGVTRVRVAGAFGADFTGNDFFSSLAAASNVRNIGGVLTLSSGENWEIRKALTAPLLRKLSPTALDRRRMDLITTKTEEIERIIKGLGKQMICLRGYGGAGKTIMLLQAAWKVFRESGRRSIFLTYNHALAADIRRSLALIGVPSDIYRGGIVVSTVMSFIYKWLVALGVIDKSESEFLDNYEEHCNTAIEMLSEKVVTSNDISALTESDNDTFDFDLVFVDEGQDWPQAEAELLMALYSESRMCIADGVDQLLRGGRVNWTKHIASESVETIPLPSCLRMKRNLSIFVNNIADSIALPPLLKPNERAGGGRIIFLTASYTTKLSLHDELIKAAHEKGNAEVDFLFCVPASNVVKLGTKKESKLGMALSNNGFQIWDGVDDVYRKDFPRSKKQYRIVQYASVRGLEGWTVILELLDEFWLACYQARKNEGLSESEELAFEDIESIAAAHAWSQVFIALTRPIDTLVITLKDPESYFSKTMMEIGRMMPDSVEFD
ncbi:hypothetical protein [Pseudidiomarina homiensis]|uniref:Uncharacterized protein n=1 Tax=Pseudidiomarina homiensis TaxID=364198 RepID=A0A432XXP3_9GAMM|nr:hypothetical protein [Pseudidiomarina homiensis]RUO53490.1 hypothetical protein CWI70_09915 [Pseudidiomarina homiensis]